MIRLGARGWELHRGWDCGGCQPFPGLRDRLGARLWMQQFKTDQQALHEIRRLVVESSTWWSLSRATTDQTIDWMANLLSDGLWHVHAPVLHDNGAAAQSDSTAPVVDQAPFASAESPRRESAPPPPKAPDEEDLLPRNADEAAIAASMKLAAQLGIPFCEECARAALKRAREAA